MTRAIRAPAALGLVALSWLCASSCGARSGVALAGVGASATADATAGGTAGSAGAGGAEADCPDCIVLGAPRLIAPLSTASVTSRHPTFRWELPPGADGARVSICRDRACTDEVARFDAAGSYGAPRTDLPSGALFWRAVARSGSHPGRGVSAVWQLHVGRRSAPVDASWGTILDVNGDGHADLVVGAYGADERAGRALLYLGDANGLRAQDPQTVLSPDDASSYFGQSVASAGDVNGDGYADVIIGAYGADEQAGRAYVSFGGSDTLPPLPSVSLTAPDGPGGFFGRSVASAGDVNGDGYADVIVGADRVNDHAGRAYVFYGGPRGTETAPAVVLDAEAGTVGHFGLVVASAGDVNADGYADVIVGASVLDRAYVYLGSAAGTHRMPDRVLIGPDSPGGGYSSIFGHEVALGGDLDGDGYSDVVVGAFPGATSFEARAYIYPGSPAGIGAKPSTTLTLATVNDRTSVAISAAHDVDGDGFDDLLVGLPGSGTAELFRGGASGIAKVPTTTLTAPSGHYFGFSVSGIGDANGDGFDDAVVTAYGGPALSATDPYLGRVYAYFGQASGLSMLPAVTLEGTAGQGSYYGYAVSAFGSVGASAASSRWE